VSAFGNTSEAYERSGSASVYLVYVTPGLVAPIARAHTRLRQLVRNGDDDLAPIAELMRFARFRLATNILPPTHPALELEDLSGSLAEHIDELDPGTPSHHAATHGQQAILGLLTADTTTIGEAALDTLAATGADECTLVLVSSRYVGGTAAYLDELGVPTEVICKNTLRGHTPQAVLVCIGPHHFFPAAAWNAARTDSVCFVQYPFGERRTASGGLFGADGQLNTPKFRVSGEAAVIEDIETMDLDEGLVAAAAREASRRSSNGPDAVEGVLLLLEGGYAVWTAVGDGSWMWSIDFSDVENPAVAAVKVENIVTGSYVIFRSRGAGSALVAAVADASHGTKKLRPAQRKWKAALASAIDAAGGHGNAVAEIRSRGAITVNLRHWVSEYSIRPNRRADYEAVTDFAGLTGESDAIWHSLSAIKRAHHRAGLTIRKELERSLITSGAQELVTNGHQRLDVAGLGTLSAFRVVHQHSDRKFVDPAIIDEPFIVEERGWHG
jgi:hypothetical protein